MERVSLPPQFRPAAHSLTCYFALSREFEVAPLFLGGDESVLSDQVIDLLSMIRKDEWTFAVRWSLELILAWTYNSCPSDGILHEMYSLELRQLTPKFVKSLLPFLGEIPELDDRMKLNLALHVKMFNDAFPGLFLGLSDVFQRVFRSIGCERMFEALELEVLNLVPDFPKEFVRLNVDVKRLHEYFSVHHLYRDESMGHWVQHQVAMRFPFPDENPRYELALSFVNSSFVWNSHFIDVLAQAMREALEVKDFALIKKLGNVFRIWMPYLLMAHVDVLYARELSQLFDRTLPIFERFENDFELVHTISTNEPVTCLFASSIPSLLVKYDKLEEVEFLQMDADRYYALNDIDLRQDFDFLRAFHVFRVFFGIIKFSFEQYKAGLHIVFKLLHGIWNAEVRNAVIVDLFSLIFLSDGQGQMIVSTSQARPLIHILNEFHLNAFIERAEQLLAQTLKMDRVPKLAVFLIRDPRFLFNALNQQNWKLGDHLTLIMPEYRKLLDLKLIMHNLVAFDIEPIEYQDIVYCEVGLCYQNQKYRLEMVSEDVSPIVMKVIESRLASTELMRPIRAFTPNSDTEGEMGTKGSSRYGRFVRYMAAYLECSESTDFNLCATFARAIKNKNAEALFTWFKGMDFDPYEFMFTHAEEIGLENLDEDFVREYLVPYRLEHKAYLLSRRKDSRLPEKDEQGCLMELVEAVVNDSLSKVVADDLVLRVEPHRILRELLMFRDDQITDSYMFLLSMVDYSTNDSEREQINGIRARRNIASVARLADAPSSDESTDRPVNSREAIMRLTKLDVSDNVGRQLTKYLEDSQDLSLIEHCCGLLNLRVFSMMERKFQEFLKTVCIIQASSERQTLRRIHKFRKYLMASKKYQAVELFFTEGVFTRFSHGYMLSKVRSIPRTLLGICYRFDLTTTARVLSEAYEMDFRHYALNLVYQQIHLGLYKSARVDFKSYQDELTSFYAEDYSKFDSDMMVQNSTDAPPVGRYRSYTGNSIDEPSVVQNFLSRKRMLDGRSLTRSRSSSAPKGENRESKLQHHHNLASHLNSLENSLSDDSPLSLPEQSHLGIVANSRQYACPFVDLASTAFFAPFIHKSTWRISVLEELQHLEFANEEHMLEIDDDCKAMKLKEFRFYATHGTSTYASLPLLTSMQMFDIAYQVLLNISDSSDQEHSFIHHFFLPSMAFGHLSAMKDYILSQDQLLLITGDLWTALEKFCFEKKMANVLLSIYSFKNQLDDAAFLSLSLYKKAPITKKMTYLGYALNHLQESIKYRTHPEEQIFPPIAVSDSTVEELQATADLVQVQLDFCQLCICEGLKMTPNMDILHSESNATEIAAYSILYGKIPLLESIQSVHFVDIETIAKRAFELTKRIEEIHKLLATIKESFADQFHNLFGYCLKKLGLDFRGEDILALIIAYITNPNEIAQHFFEYDFIIEASQFAADATNHDILPLIAHRASELGIKTSITMIEELLSKSQRA